MVEDCRYRFFVRKVIDCNAGNPSLRPSNISEPSHADCVHAVEPNEEQGPVRNVRRGGTHRWIPYRIETDSGNGSVIQTAVNMKGDPVRVMKSVALKKCIDVQLN